MARLFIKIKLCSCMLASGAFTFRSDDADVVHRRPLRKASSYLPCHIGLVVPGRQVALAEIALSLNNQSTARLIYGRYPPSNNT